MKAITALCGLLVASVTALEAGADTLTGTIKAADGKPMKGVLVRVTDDVSGVSEAVYSNADGKYTLVTQLQGKLHVRARTPYFRDSSGPVELAGKATKDLMMEAMTDPVEISDSLPAAYHFGSLPFETGEGKHFNRFQFQRDCLSCHQLGNPFTRVPRDAASWSVTIQRMHRMVGNFDAELRDRRSEILATGFDGKPLTVRPQFPLDDALDHAKIYEYALNRAFVPHDAIVNPKNGLIYTVDQAMDHMVVTNPETGQSEYVLQSGGEAMKFRKDNPNQGEGIGLFNPTDRHGPHSLDLGIDGKYYVTNTGSTSIGVFNPDTNQWEPSFKIPPESRARYPHTIRVNKRGEVWFTLAGSEKVGRLIPTTGEFTFLDLPNAVSGGISGGTQPYGIDIDPKDDSMWYGRLFGDKIGRVDPKTLEITEYDSPVRGPRRMRFDREGVLWVTGYSEGELARVTTDGFRSKVYQMPEFAEGYRPAPYALGVHPQTQEIWLNENMTDRLYRFIPSEERFVVYPVPLAGTYTRDMSFTREGKVCLSNNPIPPPALEGGVLEILCIDARYDASKGDDLALSE